MSEVHRLIKNTGIIAVGSLATKVVSFILLPLYTAVLSTSEYGTVDYVTSLVIFLSPFASLLMDEAVFRFLIDCKTDDDKREVISTSSLILVLSNTLCLILILGISVLMDYSYGPLLSLYVFSMTLSGMVSCLYRGMGETAKYAVLNFVQSLMTIVFNVIAILMLHLGVNGMLLASIVSQFGTAAFFFWRMHAIRYIKIESFRTDLAKQLVCYSLPLIPNKVSWSIMNLSDRLIIMNTMGAEWSGLYAIAYKFPSLMDIVYGFFYMSWKESSARILNSDEDENTFYNYIYRMLSRLLIGIVLVMSAFMPLIFKIMINIDYKNGILYVPILLLATFYSNISGFYGGIFTAFRDTSVMGTTTIFGAAVNLLLNFLLIPSFGLYGSSLATLVSTFAVNTYRRVKVKKYVNLSVDWHAVLIVVAETSLVFLLFYINQLWATVLNMGVSIVFFILINRDFISRVVSLARKKARKE